MTTTRTMPAVFIGHGSPMNTLEHNRYTGAWHDFGRSLSANRPRAILAISAHWYVHGTAVTAMTRPRTIHDFAGFPDELFAVQYPAPGDPELAAELAEIVAAAPMNPPTTVALDARSWGLDHGTWSVLAHMFPDADVPVVQLSVDSGAPLARHVELGAALAPLRERDVLIVASGNVVHNLRRLRWDDPDGAFDWNRTFDDDARAIMAKRPGDIAELGSHRHYQLAAPSPDHLLPLFYVAGLADAAGRGAEVLVDGYAMGSLSMTSYVLAGS
jgi:4,5-DOPA dioxygenase extradiol